MQTENVFLDITAVNEDKFPTGKKPEVAFVGRSNVGKSSLINIMVGRKSLARTSQKPGKTRTINFYSVNEQFYFVDLPGYGYAKISRSESQKWGKMIENYLLNRKQLKAIVMLVDIRHLATKNDKLMYDWLKYYDHKIIMVATKSDKIKRSKLNKHVSVLREGFELNKDDILIPFSSETQFNKEKLWNLIEESIINT